MRGMNMDRIAICDNTANIKEQIKECCEKFDAEEGLLISIMNFPLGKNY